MKKAILFSLVLVSFYLISQSAFAQNKSFYASPYKDRNSGSFSKSTDIFSLGYGIGTIKRFGAVPGYNYIPIGPIYIKYEKAIIDEIGMGGYLAPEYRIGKVNGNSYSNYLGIGIGFLAYYHFNKFIPVKKLDVYVGAGLGAKYASESYRNNIGNATQLDFTSIIFKIGARYYFKNNLGVFLESGYDNSSSLNIGISFRF